MDGLLQEQERLEKKGNLKKMVTDVQKTIDLLEKAKNAIIADPDCTAMELAKLQPLMKQSTEKWQDDMKEVRGAQNKFGKALEKKFKDQPLPTAENDLLAAHPNLVNRAVAMHLLREGQFDVASTFIREANTSPPTMPSYESDDITMSDDSNQVDESEKALAADQRAWANDFASGTVTSDSLQRQFSKMYHILGALREHHDLEPAIAWARQNSAALEARASNLEFELVRLQYVRLIVEEDTEYPDSDIPAIKALEYARQELTKFASRYDKEVYELCGALSFWTNVTDSPFAKFFHGLGSADSTSHSGLLSGVKIHGDDAYEDVAISFTREFCSLLGLSAQSPLYIAVTAGAIALPAVLKSQRVMKSRGAEWTSKEELPVETPLPPAYSFHSIFICPVSKEQTTDINPPMMLPCGHVIAKNSLDSMSHGHHGHRFKCPYCPSESLPSDAKKIFL